VSRRKEKDHIESSRSELPERLLMELLFGPVNIELKDKWGGKGQCTYDLAPQIRQIANGFNSLFPPKAQNRNNINLDAALGYKRCKSNEVKAFHIAKIACDIWREQFKSKIEESILELFLETNILTLRELAKRFPERFDNVDCTSLFKMYFNESIDKRRKRLKANLHGGTREKHCHFDTRVKYFELTLYVIPLLRLWNHITTFFEDRGYGPECIEAVKRSEEFQLYSKVYPVPQILLKDIYKRKWVKKKESSPLGFALKHVHSLLGIEQKFNYNTFKTYYYKGRNIAFEYIRSGPKGIVEISHPGYEVYLSRKLIKEMLASDDDHEKQVKDL
jgi:hypothetical protein